MDLHQAPTLRQLLIQVLPQTASCDVPNNTLKKDNYHRFTGREMRLRKTKQRDHGHIK